MEIEILVVDSGSSDGSISSAKQHDARIMQIPPEEFNHGATRNLGIAHAAYDFIVLMTQDAVPADEQLIESLVAPFEDSDVCGVFARQIPRPDADSVTKFRISNWVAGSGHREIRQILNLRNFEGLSPKEKFEFCAFDNVCSAIRKIVWERHPFQKCAFGEDIEWSKRVLERGWKIQYEPRAKVIHSHERSVFYEYKRTYVCHWRLCELFGLQTIPSWRQAIMSIGSGILSDFSITFKEERGPCRRRRLVKAPIFTLAGVLGQFYGARGYLKSVSKRACGV